MPAYDQALQTRLDALWFRMPADASADRLGDYQRSLVREFQICCRGQFGAQLKAPGTAVDADNLVQVALTAAARLPDTHWPDGKADADTLDAIQAWERAKLRCPAIFQQLRKEPGAEDKIIAQGIFFPGEVKQETDVVWVRDFTGRYPILPADGLPPRVRVGAAEKRVTTKKVPARPPAPEKKVEIIRWGNKAGAGQRIVRLTPDNLLGEAWEQMSPAKQSTFRVIAAVAFVETSEALDAINAWDSSVLSVGPYQYTAYGPNTLAQAELAAFLAYYRSAVTQGEFDGYFRNYGICPKETWSARLRGGNETFTAQLELVADRAGNFAPPATLEERDWLRSWPVIHRTRYAIANSAKLRLLMWNFARQRLSDLLGHRWPGTDPAIAATKMSDVFRTEQSVALLLRLHVKAPSATLGATMMNVIIKEAGITKPVSAWRKDEDDALVKALANPARKSKLRGLLSANVQSNLKTVSVWTSAKWGGLSTASGFKPYLADIPFPSAKEA